MTITEFLEARISEDEREASNCLANRANSKRRWHRVLAECAAKRAILELRLIGIDPCDAHDAEYKSIPCETIEALAAVYAAHPDYRQEWKA